MSDVMCMRSRRPGYRRSLRERPWRVIHDCRSTYAILRRSHVTHGGWLRLGSIIRWHDGYGWEDLDGHQDAERFTSQAKCLAAFVAEMEQRHVENQKEQP